jgi:hypothetical protein
VVKQSSLGTRALFVPPSEAHGQQVVAVAEEAVGSVLRAKVGEYALGIFKLGRLGWAVVERVCARVCRLG